MQPPSPNFSLIIALEMPRKKKEDSNFGPRLTALRKARGLTQIQLAQAAGSTQRSISYYENDDGVPPASIVVVLAKALKVSTDELLGLKPPKVEPMDDGPRSAAFGNDSRPSRNCLRRTSAP